VRLGDVMGTNFYIRNGRQISNNLRKKLKESKKIELGIYKRKGLCDYLYFVGKRHASGFNEFSIMNDKLTVFIKEYPDFTLGIDMKILKELKPDVKLYASGHDSGIETVRDLLDYLSDPFISILTTKENIS